jgi:hypothetical protein
VLLGEDQIDDDLETLTKDDGLRRLYGYLQSRLEA